MNVKATAKAPRQLEESVTWTGRERLRLLWYRLRLVVQEIKYASKRMIELQMRLPDDWDRPFPPTNAPADI